MWINLKMLIKITKKLGPGFEVSKWFKSSQIKHQNCILSLDACVWMISYCFNHNFMLQWCVVRCKEKRCCVIHKVTDELVFTCIKCTNTRKLIISNLKSLIIRTQRMEWVLLQIVIFEILNKYSLIYELGSNGRS